MIKSMRIRGAEYVARVGEGKRLLERPRRRWDDNVKMDLREMELADMDWIHVAGSIDQWRTLVKMVINTRFL
jgi:hypothetical protein